MPYTLGPISLKELQGVHPRLVDVVHLANKYTKQEFGVHDGLRTLAEQKEYVRRGVSQTMNSLHMIQSDGFGHAVDLVPFINGKLRWEWPPIYVIASAMHRACTEKNVSIIWGAVWDRKFPQDFKDPTPAGMEKEVAAYVARRKKMKLRAFIDGPHWQLSK